MSFGCWARGAAEGVSEPTAFEMPGVEAVSGSYLLYKKDIILNANLSLAGCLCMDLIIVNQILIKILIKY